MYSVVIMTTQFHCLTYHAIVWYRHKPTCTGTYMYETPCTTGHDPDEFGFSEQCPGTALHVPVHPLHCYVCIEHCFEKPNSPGSWPVVHGVSYMYVPVHVGLCRYHTIAWYIPSCTLYKQLWTMLCNYVIRIYECILDTQRYIWVCNWFIQVCTCTY